jgi:hypothetical protein
VALGLFEFTHSVSKHEVGKQASEQARKQASAQANKQPSEQATNQPANQASKQANKYRSNGEQTQACEHL